MDRPDCPTYTCNTCNKVYVGQSGLSITVRHKEHVRYIRTNNPQSAYTLHILQNRHEYGPIVDTLQLLKTCSKGTHMNCWEALYEGRTKSHEQPFFACKPGTADEVEYGGRWNQLLCYP